MTSNRNRTAVLALGGNALSPKGEVDTIANQFSHTRESLSAIRHLISEGYNLVITHGNGPQVGNALLRTELTADKAPILPLGICVADVEGGMGYMIQQSVQNLLKRENVHKDVVTIITQVLVDKNDPEIKNPSKEIGQRYDGKIASALADRFSWTVRETSSGDWRRVVPSPKPISIVEADAIRELVDAEKIVIAAGGGGIPVYTMDSGDLEGFDAVVDKDLASAIVAHEIGACDFFILTDVRTVFLNFGQKNETPIHRMTVTEAQTYLKEGQFTPGTMEPKISAAMDFINKGGERVLISAIDSLAEALLGETGTVITNQS